MKKILLLIGAILSLSTIAQAQGLSYYTTNNLAASNHVTVPTPAIVHQVYLTTTNTTPTLVYLIDGYRLKTNAAYTNFTTTTTTEVVEYITSLGTTNAYTNTVIQTAANPVAASTTTVGTPIAVIPVTSTLPVTFTPTYPLQFTSFVTLTNDAAGVNAVISYRRN
jgi:hypothetical protein